MDLRVLGLLFLTGALTRFVYWLAGAAAEGRSEGAPRRMRRRTAFSLKKWQDAMVAHDRGESFGRHATSDVEATLLRSRTIEARRERRHGEPREP